MAVKAPKFLVIRADGEPMGEVAYYGADDIGEAEEIAEDIGTELGDSEDPIDFVLLESEGWKERRIVTIPEPPPVEPDEEDE